MPVPELQTKATTLLRLSPEWSRPLEWLPALAAYVVGAPLSGDMCLVLDVRRPTLPVAVIGGLLERACDYVSEGAPFAEVLLVVDPVDLEPIEEVRSAAEVVERLGLDVPALRDDPGETVMHARWVKALVDDLQAQIDRARYEAAPPVSLSGEPLVTVRIPTFGSVELLLDRAIPSVLNGTYKNLELLVCSDGPQPHAREAVATVDDERVRYVEVPERPKYPKRPDPFWRVAGTYAVNLLLDEARGDLIAPLDHDDAFTADHISLLLNWLQAKRADFAYGVAVNEWSNATWSMLGAWPPQEGGMVHATVMYTKRLAHMRYDPDAWVWGDPGDWNLWRRIQDAGAAMTFLNWPVAVHFRERTSIEGRKQSGNVVTGFAEDILGTSARALLEVPSGLRGGLGLPKRQNRSPRRGALPANSGDGRRLAILDTKFPQWLSGFRYHEAAEILRRAWPDTVFFSGVTSTEPWPRPVYPLSQFARLAGRLGITDVYSVFLNFAVSLLGLQTHPGIATCAGVPPNYDVAPALKANKIRFHTVMYPGGGLVTDTDPALMRSVADRSATVFTNTAEAVAAVPSAIRIAGPMAVDVYEYRPRRRRERFDMVFAADHRPRKGLDTALRALDKLDERFHLHVVGPHEPFVRGYPPERLTYHGVLKPAELRELYRNCDAFVSPVRPEGPDGMPGEVGLVDGFPTTTACEALASGCALVFEPAQ